MNGHDAPPPPRGASVLVRPAAASDAAALHRVHHASIAGLAAKDYSPEQIAAWIMRPFDAAESSRLIEEISRDFIWVATLDGSVEGYVQLTTPLHLAPVVYINALYLTPLIAGQGHARTLMAKAEAKALYLGAPRVALHSSRTALGFYQRLGYRQLGPGEPHLVNGLAIERFPMAKDP